MGGCHCADSPFVQIGQNRNGKSSSLRRVCSRAQLVEQYKGLFIYLFQERNNICHVRRESTQTLLNALFVSDIRINLVKYGKFRTVPLPGYEVRPAPSV